MVVVLDYSIPTSLLGLAFLPSTLLWENKEVWRLRLEVRVIPLQKFGPQALTSSGQYHWVSEFSPYRYQKFLSYIIGE